MAMAMGMGIGGVSLVNVASAQPGVFSGSRKHFQRIHSGNSSRSLHICRATPPDKIEDSRKYQLLATEVLAELLKAPDKDKRAEELVEDLNEEFFYIASTYLAMAKKEANLDVVKQVEVALKAAMSAKDKTLRPEIRLFNKLLRCTSKSESEQAIQENHQYLHEKSYFFELLERMMKDVEAHKETPDRTKLMNQLKSINKQTRDVAKTLKRSSK